MTSKAEQSFVKLILTYPDLFNTMNVGTRGDVKAVYRKFAEEYPNGRFIPIVNGKDSDNDKYPIVHFSYFAETEAGRRVKMEVLPYVNGDRLEIRLIKYGYVSEKIYAPYDRRTLAQYYFVNGERTFDEALRLLMVELRDYELRVVASRIEEERTRREEREKLTAERRAELQEKRDDVKSEVYQLFNITAPNTTFDALYEAVAPLGTLARISTAIQKLLPLLK
jgi:hypothetical protein